jgi:hypothetical protein
VCREHFHTPRGHIPTSQDNEKVPQTTILVPLVHFTAHFGHVSRLRERREVVLDRMHVCRDHFHVPRGNVHLTEEAMKVTERRIHRPKSHVFPIQGHERVPFDRKEVVLDPMHVCRDHFHVPGDTEKVPQGGIHVWKGSIHPGGQPNVRPPSRWKWMWNTVCPAASPLLATTR